MNRKSYWGIAALIVFVIAAGGFIYWQLSEVQQFKKQLAQEAEELLRQSKKSKKVSKTGNKAEQATGVTAAESETPTAEKQNADATAMLNNTEASQTEAAVRVSKFGFGPYPEIPPDFPYPDMFDASLLDNVHDPDDPDYELMYRVWVELWKRGERGVEGMGTRHSTGLFYPTIRGTIYVEWGPRWEVFGQGIGRSIRYIDGHPDDLKRLKDLRQDGHRLLGSDIPADIKVLDMSEGINPYKFLNLPQPQ